MTIQEGIDEWCSTNSCLLWIQTRGKQYGLTRLTWTLYGKNNSTEKETISSILNSSNKLHSVAFWTLVNNSRNQLKHYSLLIGGSGIGGSPNHFARWPVPLQSVQHTEP